ncbi:hypothetical protein D3C72_744700 [compost metagenome]
MGRDAEAVALGQLAAPAGLLGRHFDHVLQSGGVDGVLVALAAVIPARHRELAVLADEREQEVLGVFSGGRGQLVDEAAGGEGVVDVGHRAEPADAHMRLGEGVLEPDVGDVEGLVLEAHAELEVQPVQHLGHRERADRRKSGAVQPARDLVGVIQARLEVLGAHGVVVAVANLVLAGPLHAHGRLDRFRQQGGLDHEVRLGLASEPAAQ